MVLKINHILDTKIRPFCHPIGFLCVYEFALMFWGGTRFVCLLVFCKLKKAHYLNNLQMILNHFFVNNPPFILPKQAKKYTKHDKNDQMQGHRGV